MTQKRPTIVEIDGIKIDAEKQLLEIDKWECEQSLFTFLERCWHVIDPSEFEGNWHIEAVAEHAEAVCDGHVKRIAINIPPRSCKTKLLSIAFPAWVWAQRNKGPMSGPQVSFLFVSYNEALAMSQNVECRRLIKSEWYTERWGDRFSLLEDADTKSSFSNDKGGSRSIASIGSRVTGRGADCLVGDTMVSTPNGPKKIMDILPGDEVFGFDILQDKVVKTLVEATRRLPARNLYEVSIPQGNTVRCSGNHPFFDPRLGYVPAENLGAGNGLCVLRGEQEQKRQDNDAHEMLDVPCSFRETSLRTSQSLGEGSDRCVLHGGVLAQSPCLQEHQKALQELRESDDAHSGMVLHGTVQIGKTTKQDGCSSAKSLPVLQDDLCSEHHVQKILQRRLPEHEPFDKYQGVKEPEIQKGGCSPLWGLLRIPEANDIGERRPCVCDMRVVRAEENAVEREECGPASCSPYRLGSEQQLSRKSDNDVRFLSPDCPQIEQVSKVHVEKYGGREDWMYDIQVAGTNNFFANGFLVHNCIVLDDPNATNDAESEAILKTTNDFFDNTLRSRLNNKKTGAIMLIQQRVSEIDLSGHILDKYEGWDHLMIPLEFEVDRRVTTSIGWTDPRKQEGEPLWPERFDEEFVRGEKSNPYVFSGQYQQRPAPKGGGIIKSDWWLRAEVEDKNGKILFPPFDYILASLDTAYGNKENADHSAMTVWGVFYENIRENAATRYLDADGNIHYGEIGPKTRIPKVMLIYAWSANLEFHELIDRVAKECKRFKVDKLIVEAKASGISVAQELKRLYKNERWMVQLVNPGNMDKVARLHSVVPIFANGLVHAPDTDWAQMAIEQVSQFPKGRYRDLTDTVSQGLRHIRDIGMLETREEVETDLEEHMAFDSNAAQGMYF